jgi:UDP-sugar transporter A1/2/3
MESWYLNASLISHFVQSAARDLTPFKGWTITTVFVMLVQAGGGLLVAATLKYADAILKTLAVSGSIVLSALLGCAFLGGMLDLTMGMGCFCTMLAIANYTFVDKPPVKE